MTISMADGGALCVTYIPKRLKPSQDEALVAALCITGTPEELDRDLVPQVRSYVARHGELSSNLAEVQREMDEASKRSREEARKRSGKRADPTAKPSGAGEPIKSGEAPAAASATPEPLSLFDAPEAAGA